MQESKIKPFIKSLQEFFSIPSISAVCQAHPIMAGIAAFLGQRFSQEQYETLEDFMHLLNERVRQVENRCIGKGFLETRDGRRIIGKVFKSVVRDNRKEKLLAMANLTINLYYKSKLSIDEKELFVDILDGLNSLQLSILQKAVIDMNARKNKQGFHRGLGWELLAQDYIKMGVSKSLLLQSIRVLESNGMINQNNASIVQVDQTHYITDFGELFYYFISNPLTPDSPYLSM